MSAPGGGVAGGGGGTPCAGAASPGNELLTVTVVRNDSGYGMKVSGDNPVYVQSVKEGGAAWRAGLRAGDRIMRVNGVPVPTHTHLQVVQMIRATPSAVLTVYQNSQRHKTPITAPVPVDQEKQRQLEFTKVSTIRLMLENEQKHLEALRNMLSKTPDSRKQADLESTEQRCVKLQHQIDIITSSLPHQDLGGSTPQLTHPQTPKLGNRSKYQTNLDKNSSQNNSTGFLSGLPRSLSNLTGQSLRNLRQVKQNMTKGQQENQPPSERDDETSSKRSRHNNTVPMVPITCLDGNIAPPPLPPRSTDRQKPKRNPLSPPASHIPINPLAKPKMLSPSGSVSQSPVHRWSSPKDSPYKSRVTQQYSMDVPQTPLSQKSSSSPQYRTDSPQNKYRRSAHSLDTEYGQDLGNGQPNSISMQMSYPLVSHPQPPIQMDVRGSGIPILHIRSQSSPEHLDQGQSYGADQKDGRAWERTPPPGTPPPPYPHGRPCDTQRAIISMEEDDSPTSDNSCNSGLFSNLRSVRESKARTAVLLNWLLGERRCASANIFLLITDGYRSAAGVPIPTLQRWAYEIQSTFVMPNAVLALNGVDENMAREIDDILLNEYNKEELLRNVFRKARAKAKEELAQQLSEFQVKRQVGLGMLYGPEDSVLEKCDVDKAQESIVVERLLTERLTSLCGSGGEGDVWGCGAGSPAYAPLLASTAAAALVLHVRPQAVTAAVGGGARAAFLQRDKHYKQRLKQIVKQTPQPFVVRGHHFSLQAVTSVVDCQHCTTVIWGLAPQAYVCSDCDLRVHRSCARKVEESCCLDGEQHNNRISRFIEKIQANTGHQEANDKKSRKISGTTHFLNMERSARKLEDEQQWETHQTSQGDARREGSADDSACADSQDPAQEQPLEKDDKDGVLWRSLAAPGGKPVNRAESCREPAAAGRRGKQRNASDPNKLTAKAYDCEPGTGAGAPSGSSSSSSLSSRSNESGAPTADHHASQSDWSEEEEPLAEQWSVSVSQHIVDTLSARLRKRQELIHELITSESSHVRWLKVLQTVFLRPLERGEHGQMLTSDEVKALFPNLPAVRERHNRLYADLKALRKGECQIVQIRPLADAMLHTLGDASYAPCLSRFCRGQRMALDALRERRRKNKELHQFLSSKEALPLCGRLQLRDLVAVVWQRLTKYQLLLEGVLKTVSDEDDDCEEDSVRLRLALDTAKDVLHRVDTAIRTAENEHRLRSIQSKLEVRGGPGINSTELEEMRKLDLTQHKLLFEGDLSIRTDTNKKSNVLALLMAECLILLQREGEKFVLKQMSSMLTPIIKWSTVLFRPNAAVKNTFFLMNINGVQMYELSANSATEYNAWTKYISEAPLAEARAGRAPSLQHNRDKNEDSSGVSRNASDASRTSASSNAPEEPESQSTPEKPDRSSAERPPISAEPPTIEREKTPEKEEEKPKLTMNGRITTHEFDPPPLTTAIHVETVATAQFAQKAVSTEERLRRLDDSISKALKAKSVLVAEMLGVPVDSFNAVADLAVAETLGQVDVSTDMKAARLERTDSVDAELPPGFSGSSVHQLLLAAQAQANQLTEALTRALNVTEADVISARHYAPWRDTAGLCDSCTKRRTKDKKSSDAAIDNAQNAAEDLDKMSQSISEEPEKLDLSVASKSLETSAIEKEVSFDMLSELGRSSEEEHPVEKEAEQRLNSIVLEEIGESSTDPITAVGTGGAYDSALATRLVPLACGLQGTLAKLLHTLPSIEEERARLRRELAAERDAHDALRRLMQGRPTEDIESPPLESLDQNGQDQTNSGG